jgi:hypothetical protein
VVTSNRGYVEGSLVGSETFKVLLAAKNLTFVPDLGMVVIVDAVRTVITDIGEIRAGNLVTAYELTLVGDGTHVPSGLVEDFDREILPIVVELINEFGVDATFDVAGGTTIRVSPPFKHLERYARHSLIDEKMDYIIFPASGLTFFPARGMKVLVVNTNTKKKIESVDIIWAQEQVAAYIAYLGAGA